MTQFDGHKPNWAPNQTSTTGRAITVAVAVAVAVPALRSPLGGRTGHPGRSSPTPCTVTVFPGRPLHHRAVGPAEPHGRVPLPTSVSPHSTPLGNPHHCPRPCPRPCPGAPPRPFCHQPSRPPSSLILRSSGPATPPPRTSSASTSTITWSSSTASAPARRWPPTIHVRRGSYRCRVFLELPDRKDRDNNFCPLCYVREEADFLCF